MLNREEESRLAAIRGIIYTNVIRGAPVEFDTKTLVWLTTKLKEVNEEASAVSAELQKANEDLANLVEYYEGS